MLKQHTAHAAVAGTLNSSDRRTIIRMSEEFLWSYFRFYRADQWTYRLFGVSDC
ncbi:hypothetical protein Misp06_02622 [Microbulbifer sp. NBRC 101763]